MNQSDYVLPMNRPQRNNRNVGHRQRHQGARRKRLHQPTHSDSVFDSTGTFLQPEEIHSLTDRTRRHAQVKVLSSLGIEHKVRPDGGIAVLRAHINKVFDGNPEAASHRQQKVASPNWLAI
jgi:hypothetical protein